MKRGSHLAWSRSRVQPDSAAAASAANGHAVRTGQADPGQEGLRQDGRDRVAEVGRGSTLNLTASAVAAVATTGVTVLVTNFTNKTEAGAFFTATSLFLIIGGVAALGTNVGLTYFIARLRSLGEHSKIPAIMRAAIIPVVVASVASAAILILAAEPLAHAVLRGRAAHSFVTPGAVADALRALAVTLPFAGLLNAHLGASRGYGDMRPTALVGQVGLTLGKLLGVVLAVVAGSAALLAPLWALPYLPMAIIAWLWGRRITRDHGRRRPALTDVPPEVAALLALAKPVPPPGNAVQARALMPPGQRTAYRRPAKSITRSFWSFTTPRAIANTAQNILQQIDIVLVAVIRGPEWAAVYTAATRFLVLGQLGGMAINRASQTRFTELFTLGNRRGANTLYRITTGWLILLMWPLYLLTVVYGPVILTIFGHSYRAGDTVIVILGFAQLLNTACGQVDMVLITSGRSSWSLVNGLLTVSVNVGVDLALIPRYGITGAAIGWAVAILVMNLMPLIQLGIVLRLHPFGRGPFVACALSAVSFGAIPFAIRAVLGEGPIALVLGVGAGCALQAAGLWRFRGMFRLSAMFGSRAAKAAEGISGTP